MRPTIAAMPKWPGICASCLRRSQRLSQRSITTMSAIHHGLRGDSNADKMRSQIAKYEARQRRRGSRTLIDEQQQDADYSRSQSQDEPQHFGSISVPHTTAASKFIFGYSTVLAALKAKRRLLYKLYYHPRAKRRAHSAQEKEKEMHEQDMILALASEEGKVQVKQVKEDFLAVMDRISGGRPHNGIVLETSPLPVKPVERLTAVSRLYPWFNVTQGRQSPEEMLINGTDDRIRYNSHGWRYPLVLFLYGITDTGNLGGILRSAHYLGVDAVALASRSTASVDDPVVIKASSGATEAVRILRVSNPYQFIFESGNNGWRTYAAEAPPPPEDNLSFNEDWNAQALDQRNTSPLVSFHRGPTKTVMSNHVPLARHPVILMMGGEHTGIDAKLAARANYQVGIRGVQALDVGVDSMNVSVASAIIMMEMLRRPEKALKKFDNAPKPGSNYLF